MIPTPPRIDERDPAIAAYLDEWKTNRAMIEGERAVKKSGAKFIPKSPLMLNADYAAMVQRTAFFPGAARTFEGLKGLIARKPATVTAPDSVTDILRTITAQGYTLDTLANRIMGELLVTNFVGLLVDYPPSATPMTQAQAIERGIRPFVAMFTAENILGIEIGVINNRQRVTRVRLQDNKDSIRELRLDDGVYSVTMWFRDNRQWHPGERVVPTKGGKPIDEIPFTLVATSEEFEPTKSPMTDVCAINKDVFVAQSNLAQCLWWSGSPVSYIVKKMSVNEKGEVNEPTFNIAPGVMLMIDALPNEVELGFHHWQAGALGEIRAEVDSLKSDMAKMGARMLANDKAVAEAAETEAIRRAAENAIVAIYSRVRDRKLNDALSWLAWWLDLPEDAITYESSTDYNVVAPEASVLTFLKSLYDGGIISRDTFIDLLIENDILPENYDREADADKIAQEIADRPPVIAMPAVQSTKNEAVDNMQ